jgi:serine/threonine protein phosphatase 1
VAQGHLIQTEPRAAEGRILVDTGAWRSGRLSAALLGPAGLEFVQVQV